MWNGRCVKPFCFIYCPNFRHRNNIFYLFRFTWNESFSINFPYVIIYDFKKYAWNDCIFVQYDRKINVILGTGSPKQYPCTMSLRESLQCHYGTSVPWYLLYKVKSPNTKLRTNGHGIVVILWHNVWYFLTTKQEIGEFKRLFQRVLSPFHLRIVRFLDIVLQLILPQAGEVLLSFLLYISAVLQLSYCSFLWLYTYTCDTFFLRVSLRFAEKVHSMK